MNVLLTGSTGFLGFRTLERLVQLPQVNLIVATGRFLRASRKITDAKVNYVLGDLEDSSFVNSLLKNIDVVINTASLSSPWGTKDAFYTSNVVTQKNIINAAKKKDLNIIHLNDESEILQKLEKDFRFQKIKILKEKIIIKIFSLLQ